MRSGGRPHFARWVALAVLATAGVLVGVLATLPPASATEAYTPLLGKQAPRIDTTTLSGRQFRLTSLRGRWVLLNFFATWCGPCQQEQSDLVAFARHNAHKGGAAIVGVVFDDSASDARQFFVQSRAKWPVLLDPGGQIALDYGVRGPPETFVISPAGTVLIHLDGPLTTAGIGEFLSEAQRGVA